MTRSVIAALTEYLSNGSVVSRLLVNSINIDKYSVNAAVTDRVIAVAAKGANKPKPVSEENPAKFHAIQLSLRSEDVSGDEKATDAVDHLSVKLSSNVTGTLSCVEVSEDVEVVLAFQDEFPACKRVKCFVLQVDDEKKTVDLSLSHSSSAQEKAVVKFGIIVNGVISTKTSAVHQGAHTYDRLCITELLVKWENNMLELPQFAAGKVVRCVVLSNNNHIDLSLREDALANPKEYAQKTSKSAERGVGDLVPAVVANNDDRDDFVKSPQAQFPTGKLVSGRVTKKSDRGLELSLKAPVVSEDVSAFKWTDLKEGLTVKGTITKVQTYGVFVRIERLRAATKCS
ncbi:hypothetical protein PF001_g3289 [Phytophthora fragariae]|uniref:S1 motif domain-containing protein n=1 Tax=Phytophthora fragariae TaxID=53985 RepID=A0A6A4EV20_9STRA|nr:hypothetical protein PF001_g3289 [Phytophthora fragariae]